MLMVVQLLAVSAVRRGNTTHEILLLYALAGEVKRSVVSVRPKLHVDSWVCSPRRAAHADAVLQLWKRLHDKFHLHRAAHLHRSLVFSGWHQCAPPSSIASWAGPHESVPILHTSGIIISPDCLPILLSIYVFLLCSFCLFRFFSFWFRAVD